MPTDAALVLGPLSRALPRILVADDPAPDPHVVKLGALWAREVDRATARWGREVSPEQLASLIAQVESAVHADSVAAMTAIAAPVLGAELLLDSMRSMAGAGAAAVVAEAADAGVRIDLAPPAAASSLADWARAGAQMLADSYAAGVAREALRLMRPGVAAAAVATGVRAYVKKLTDRGPRDVIGANLTRAQNLGRLETYRQAPPGIDVTLVADETNDARTCGPCRKIDGTVLPTPEAAALAYGGAGYLWCEGGSRCRGTVRGNWDTGPKKYPGGMTNEQAVRAAWSHSDIETGMTAEVTGVRDGYNGSKWADIKIKDHEGNVVGSATRLTSGDGRTIQHTALHLNPEVRGQGFASRFNAHAEATYRANGVREITLTAEKIGRYSWARAGYDFKRDTERREIGWKLNAMASRFDKKTAALITELTARDDWTPLELAMLGWRKGVKTWPGREIMLGPDFPLWDGVKTL